MSALKSCPPCADVLQVMGQSTPQRDSNNEQQLGLTRTDDIAVSASELIEMIRSGQSEDVNDLVRRTLSDRHAA